GATVPGRRSGRGWSERGRRPHAGSPTFPAATASLRGARARPAVHGRHGPPRRGPTLRAAVPADSPAAELPRPFAPVRGRVLPVARSAQRPRRCDSCSRARFPGDGGTRGRGRIRVRAFVLPGAAGGFPARPGAAVRQPPATAAAPRTGQPGRGTAPRRLGTVATGPAAG